MKLNSKSLVILSLVPLTVFGHNLLREFGNIKLAVNTLRSWGENILDNSGITNVKCVKDLRLFMKDTFRMKLWALQMLDANPKPQPGILTGNVYFHGNYDECLAINRSRSDGDEIIGKYCNVLLYQSKDSNATKFVEKLLDIKELTEKLHMLPFISRTPLPKIRGALATCIPASCSIENLQTIWNYVERKFDLPYSAVFNEHFCDYKGKSVASFSVDIYVYWFFGLVIAAALLSTVYDVCWRKTDADDDFLVAFSLYSNMKGILAPSQDATSLTCLSGIKVISMAWIIIGHRMVLNGLFTPNMNTFYVLFEHRQNYLNSYLFAAPLSVDTFLIISGLLLMYAKSSYSAKHKISILQLYSVRFIRLAPALIAVILFYISILKNLSSGPMWPVIAAKTAHSCHQNWWGTLFQMTNLFPAQHMCAEHTWYLAVDSQLYLLSPLILFNIDKHPKKTLLGMTLVGLCSMLYGFLITVQHQLGSLVIHLHNRYANLIYCSTVQRAPAWLIGLFFGYLIFNSKQNKYTLKSSHYVVLMSVSLSLMALIILSHTTLATTPYDVYIAASYNAFVRPIWAILVGTVIFCCSSHPDGIANKCLSLPVFSVVGKLSYSMYLMHVPVMLVMWGEKRIVGYFSTLSGFHDFFGDFVITFAVALVVCLLFESPVIAIVKAFEKMRVKLGQKKDKETNTPPQEDHNKYIMWILSIVVNDKRKEKAN